jgi:serine/threonine protein kinase
VHLLTGCAPSAAQAGDPAPPQKAAGSFGTVVYAPPENTSKYTHASQYQSGDIWAIGIMLFAVVRGAIAWEIEDDGDKRLFADAVADNEHVLWHKYLRKAPLAGKETIPSEWFDVIDLLKGLLRKDPTERLSAGDALQHKLFTLADQHNNGK